MLVSLFTDASVVHSGGRNKSAGWAFWARSARGIRKGGGPLRYAVGTANDAEMAAVVNAIHMLRTSAIFEPDDCLLIAVDNVRALNVLSGVWRAKTSVEREIQRKFEETIGITEVQFRHIKAHSGSDTPRTWVHSWCDHTARKYARGGFVGEKI